MDEKDSAQDKRVNQPANLAQAKRASRNTSSTEGASPPAGTGHRSKQRNCERPGSAAGQDCTPPPQIGGLGASLEDLWDITPASSAERVPAQNWDVSEPHLPPTSAPSRPAPFYCVRPLRDRYAPSRLASPGRADPSRRRGETMVVSIAS